jgi:simple sugar transport system permease protein
MYVGGIGGVIGAFLYEMACGNAIENMNPFLAIIIPLLCSVAGSVLMGLIYSFLTVTLRANQNVTGLALTTFGIGIGNFFGGSLATLYGEGGSLAMTDISKIFRATIPLPEGKFWEIFGNIFLTYGFLAYLAIIIAVIAGIVLTKTRVGLNLRAVGDNPATADAAGINVIRYKYVATILGGTIAGLGGLYFIMDYTSGIWSNGGFGDRGWLAIALVIFAIWRPNIGIFGSILFGGLYIVYLFIPGLSRADQELFKMLPYIVTIVVLIATSMRKKRENQPPAHLGLSYFREER